MHLILFFFLFFLFSLFWGDWWRPRAVWEEEEKKERSKGREEWMKG